MILPAGQQRPARVTALIASASEIVELAAGKRLRIETMPDGEEVLDVVVPPGKHWSIGVVVSVTETDV